jgi:hypothetical protein
MCKNLFSLNEIGFSEDSVVVVVDDDDDDDDDDVCNAVYY